MDVFQTFPLHPQPAPLESFSGYLLRLAAANRILTAGRLFRLIFPQEKRNTESICDFVPVSFGILPQVTVCPEPLLLQTTFHYLLTRFLPQKQTSIHGNFLASVLSDCLRFCPLCVAETGCYHLVWRFQLLPGCVQHHCYLLDRCPSCGSQIPIFATPLRMGRCLACGSRLSDAIPAALTSEDGDLTRMRWHDLTFLLTPWHESGWVRPRIAAAREQCGFTLTQMARFLSLRQQQVKGMEARFARPVPAFEQFVNYLDALGWSFHELFELPPPVPDWSSLVQRVTSRRQQALFHQADQKERDLLKRARSVAVELLTAGKPVTIQTVAAALALNSADVKKYPALVNLLDEQRQQRRKQYRKQREAELLAQLEVALQQMGGQHLTRMGICLHLGIQIHTLKTYPQAWALVDQTVCDYQKSRAL
jgi:hypothetical protein